MAVVVANLPQAGILKEAVMFQMIRANLLTNRSILAWLSILFGMILVIGFVLNQHFVPVNFYIGWVVMAMFLQTDDRYKVHSLFCSLPMTRTRIVKTRYFTLLISFLMTMSFSFLVLGAITIIPMEGVNVPPISISQIAATAIPLTILYAAILPCYFQWGYNKGLWPAMILVALVSIGISWGLNQYVAAKLGAQVLEKRIIDIESAGILDLMLSGYIRAYYYFGHTAFLLVMCTITALLLWGSMRLSIKLFQRKDL